MRQNFDNPAMVLISVRLNGFNYRGWNQAMKIALGAKNKIAFVEGKFVVPKDGSKDYEMYTITW